MVDQKSTDAAVTALIKEYYNKQLIERLEPQTRLYQYAEKKPIPMGEGKTIEFTGYRNQKPIVSNSGEMSSTQSYISAYTITSSLIQRHDYVKLSTLLKQISIDTKVEGAVDIMGDKMGKTVEIYMRQQVVGQIGTASRSSAPAHSMNTDASHYNTQGVLTGTSAQRTHIFWSPFPVLHNKTRLSSSGANVCTIAGSAATISQIKHGVSFLRARDVQPFDNGDYVFYCHPWVADKLMQDPSWKYWNANNSGDNAGKMMKGEVGKVFGARIVTSNAAFRYVYSAAPLTSSSGAFNASLLIGKGAFGCSEITSGGNNQNGFQITVHNAGSGGVYDPNNLISTVGGKMVMCATVLNKSSACVIVNTDKVVSSAS